MGLLHNIIKYCLFSKNEKDNLQYPEQQVTYMGKTADVFIVLPYGFHANIPEGFPGLLVQVNGQEHNRAAIPMSPNERPKNLESGDVVYYSPVTGEKILFKASGGIFVTGDITFEDNITVNGDLTVNGDTILKNVTSNGINIGSTHVHGGVESGGSNTGGPF